MDKNPKGYWDKAVFEGSLTHGRKYSKEELWDNYTYFIKQIVPLAEELGMRIGIHPDDPPVPELGGVPRCIFGNFDGYVRALEIANSPNIGVCLCAGTWMGGCSWRVPARGSKYLLSPHAPYEQVGDVPNVVFPCAALVDRDADRIAIYYGAADTVVCLAFAHLSEITAFARG